MDPCDFDVVISRRDHQDHLRESPCVIWQASLSGGLHGIICMMWSLKNTRHSPNVGLMLAQRRRRWASISPTLGQWVVFAGDPWFHCHRLLADSFHRLLVGWHPQAGISSRSQPRWLIRSGCVSKLRDTALQTVQRPGVCSAGYGTMHYKKKVIR